MLAPVIVGGLALLMGTGAVLVTRRRRPVDEN
jgi:LPXTG-motif cell wall-anchored protein